MKQGTFEQMKEHKKNLPSEILELESDNVAILVVPKDINDMIYLLRQFNRKPSDEEISDMYGKRPYTVRKITFTGANIGYLQL